MSRAARRWWSTTGERDRDEVAGVSRLVAPERLTLGFSRLEIGALFLGVLIGGHVAGDGRSIWYKGVQLVAFYLILATTFYLIPLETVSTFGRSP
jgi:hypothetical protein